MIGSVRINKLANITSLSTRNLLAGRSIFGQIQIHKDGKFGVSDGYYASIIPHSTFITHSLTPNNEPFYDAEYSRRTSVNNYNMQRDYPMDSPQISQRYPSYKSGGYNSRPMGNRYGYNSGYGGYSDYNRSRPPIRPFGRGNQGFQQQLAPVHWDNVNLVEIKKDFYDLSYEADSRPGEEIEAILKEHNIIIEGEVPLPKPVISFDEAVFNDPIQRLIKLAGFSEPTPIQKVGWTSCLTGRDVVGVSQTGSGKTLTFLLPGILHLLAQPPVGNGGPIVLILAPTRELCLQISNEAAPYLRELNLRGTAAYGGVPKYAQQHQLSRGVEIMVATPGRLIDLLSTGSVRLDRVSYLVLDEADRMFDMGFEPQIRNIFSQVRPDRQILLFSATWPKSIRLLASEFCGSDLIYIQVGDMEVTANPKIRQRICPMNSQDVMRSLDSFLETDGVGKKILIFSDTKRFAESLAYELKHRGFNANSLHGDLTQAGRERVMAAFRKEGPSILVATDIASRGLDVKDIDFVVNLDVPKTFEDYIHRIGRTARGNKTGDSILYFPLDLMTPTKVKFAKDLIEMLNKLGQTVPQEILSIAERY